LILIKLIFIKVQVGQVCVIVTGSPIFKVPVNPSSEQGRAEAVPAKRISINSVKYIFFIGLTPS